MSRLAGLPTDVAAISPLYGAKARDKGEKCGMRRSQACGCFSSGLKIEYALALLWPGSMIGGRFPVRYVGCDRRTWRAVWGNVYPRLGDQGLCWCVAKEER
ncbi:hypothetical protein Lesp01_70710 [Lentzea sp. NBRC 102530]|nr:hypothetical protein Lesp01_70710 [Lentzea sp. NBRC 102530]